MKLPNPMGIYAILDTGKMPLDDLPAAAQDLARAGIRVFQIRAKDCPDDQLLQLTIAVRKVLDRGEILLINDRVDIAAIAPCDGVHLGDLDLPVAQARLILGPDAIIGYSTHSPMEASQDHGGDYIGVGPIFESTTKPSGRDLLGISGLEQACKASPVPVVAIGGITLDDIREIRDAGASGIAMISALLVPGKTQQLATEATAKFFGDK